MYLNNILGNNGMNTFEAMQQQGQQAIQQGMQAQNALMQSRGSAMQAYQQQEAEKKAREQQALSLGLSIATGGLGGIGGAAGAAEAAATEAALPSILQNVTGTGQILPMLFF